MGFCFFVFGGVDGFGVCVCVECVVLLCGCRVVCFYVRVIYRGSFVRCCLGGVLL